MALEVVWSEKAEQQLDEIIAYLTDHWTDKEITKFFQKLENAIEQIKKAPHRNKTSDRRADTKELQLTSHTTLFYSYNKSTIHILLLWANKKNPLDLK
jgi:plasmid stabilization system protein ParE